MDTEQLAQAEQDIIARFEPNYFMSDYDVYSFVQIWPTTDLGFIGFGDDAQTAATTYVFVAKDNSKAYVYFDTNFAYIANPKNRNFKQDLKECQLVSVLDADRYK